MNRTKVHLGVIQETLLIPLWARACELQAADPIVVDPKSSEIIAAIDYEFDKFATAKCSHIGSYLRETIFDNWVCTYLNQHPQASVIEIGAGLNTRFERVNNAKI